MKWTATKLKAAGYDGLWNPEIPCGCGIDDFMPCAECDGDEAQNGCKPAYRQYCDYCDVKDCVLKSEMAYNGKCYGPMKDRRPPIGKRDHDKKDS